MRANRSFFLYIGLMIMVLGSRGWSTKDQAPSAPPYVVVSIKPLHSLVCAVMNGVGDPILLLSGQEDPHHFQMTSGHIRHLRRADILFWIGPVFEAFLAKAIRSHEIHHASLMNARGVCLLYNHKPSGCFLESGCEKASFDPVAEPFDMTTRWHDIDPHLWLDPKNARAMLYEIAYQLAAIDIHNAKKYNYNARLYDAKLSELEDQLSKLSLGKRHEKFLVFHNAYSYFEKRYGFYNLARELIADHQEMSLQSVEKIRSALLEGKIKCLYAEPQKGRRLEESMAQEFSVKIKFLDVLGVNLEAGLDLYEKLMVGLMNALLDCKEEHDGK